LLLDGLSTVLKWLGVIPDGIREAQKETQKLQESAAKQATQKAPVAWEWDPAQKKMVQKTWSWSSDAAENNSDNKPAIPAPAVPGEVKGTSDNPAGNPGSKSPLDEAWFRQGIQKTASNTGGLLEETRKRTGPGDIVFKNLPAPEIIHGEWKAPQIARTTQAADVGAGVGVLSMLWQKLTGNREASPVPAVNVPAPVVNVARQVSTLPQPRNAANTELTASIRRVHEAVNDSGGEVAPSVPAVNTSAPVVDVPAPVVNVARQVSTLPQPRNAANTELTASIRRVHEAVNSSGGVASPVPVAEVIRPPLRPEPARKETPRQMPVAGFSGEIHVHLHNVNTQNPRELAKLVGEAVREETRKQARAGMNSYRDFD
ncbi:TPA: phage tail tape measure protein, partial [Escherichia coli]|nr:phage tail tape measure protein [Escherichia coli]